MGLERAALGQRLSSRLADTPPWALIACVPFVGWGLYSLALGERRWEVVALMLLIPSLAVGGPGTRRALSGLYPVALVGLMYDAMRFVQFAGLRPQDVHDCDLRALDARLFGITLHGARTTVHDWLQAHPSRVLDLVCAVPYGTFIFVAIAFAVYLFRRDLAALQRFSWSFFLMNLTGFITYHLYPAAPPWYFHAHGCAVDLGAHASEGPNLARVDAMLGVPYFHSFYGRSHDVFGAVPSLHVGYPMLIALVGWSLFSPPLRALSAAFLVTMCFAAVYLDHHWVVDVALGLTYAFSVHAVVTAVQRRAQTASLREVAA